MNKVFSLVAGMLLICSSAYAAYSPSTFSAPASVSQNTPLPTLHFVTPQMYGAKCDGSTDDSTALQNLENAAAASSYEIIYPSGTCKFGTTITMGIGVIHRGHGMGNTTLQYTGSGWAFSLLLPNGTSSIQAPSFYDLTLNTPNAGSSGGGIKYNDPTHGFTDDASSQEFMFQPFVERVLMNGPNPGGIAIQCSKCFDGRFQNNNITFFNDSVDVEGSDNMAIIQNWLDNCVVQCIFAQAHSSFGNYLLISHNDMSNVVSGGTSYITANYRSAFIEYNHLESDSSTVTQMIAAVGQSGAVYSIHDNVVTATTGQTSCWLAVSGGFTVLSVRNNLNNAGTNQPRACFNSGTGMQYFYNSAERQLIDAIGNLEFNANFPFISGPENLITPPSYIPVSGNVVWDFTPNLAGLQPSNAGATIYVLASAFTLPPSATDNISRLNFAGPLPVPSGVDIWFCGYGASGTPTITVGDGTTTATQALTTTNACYKLFSNDTTTPTAIFVKNADTGTGVNIQVTEIKVLVH